MAAPLRGEVTPPGDKSISHRALILGALARGESRISGLNEGEDLGATRRVLAALGVRIERDGDTVAVGGTDRRLVAPSSPLRCGNSGTTMRLSMGLLAGQPFEASLVGDRSLSARPMERVATPLRRMGADVDTTAGHAPVRVLGRDRLVAIDHRSDVASAQVKSAVLIAGLRAAGTTRVTEPVRSRDHTERMLEAMGAAVRTGGSGVEIDGGTDLAPLRMAVPGDPSAAAFHAAAAAIVPGSRIVIRGVSANPTRTGFVGVLERMGARIRWIEKTGGVEPSGDLEVENGPLAGTAIEAAEVPSLIDEIPVLCVVAATASSPTRITGAGELRVKESDRLRAIREGLTALGVEVTELEDGLVIAGGGFTRGATIDAHGDHRIAMSFRVAALAVHERVDIRGAEVERISDPGFGAALSRLAGSEETRATRMTRIRVAIDGPSASGKTTTARAVAERLGYRYLDSGALYRALALAVIRRGVSPASEADVAAVAGRIEAGYLENGHVLLEGEDVEDEIRTPAIAECASRLGVYPPAREWVNEKLREASRAGGVVVEGRDIGTVVLPDAEVKVFLQAAIEVRSARRRADLSRRGREVSIDSVRADIEKRDRRDTERVEAPLRPAETAVRIDGSTLSFEEQVEAVLVAVAERT